MLVVCHQCDSWREELGDRLHEEINWEKTVMSSKDLVTKSGQHKDMIRELKGEIINWHVMSRWQRKQYQLLLDTLPSGEAILTVEYAENCFCKL